MTELEGEKERQNIGEREKEREKEILREGAERKLLSKVSKFLVW